MSLLLTLGFERQETTSERLVVTTGSVEYSTDVSDAGSEGSLHVQGETLATKSVSTNYEVWMFFRLKRTATGGVSIGLSDPYSTDIMLNFDGGTLSVLVTGVEIVSGSISSDTLWHTYHVHINTFFEDQFVRIYKDGDLENPIVEFAAGDNWGFAAPTNLMIKGTSEADYLIDDIVIMDPTDAVGLVDVELMKSPTIKAFLAIDDGEKATQSAGDYTDIASLPPNFTDKLEYAGADQESTFVPDPFVETYPVLSKTVWERHILNSIYYGSKLQLQLNIPGDADVYSDEKSLIEKEFLTGEPLFGLEQIFEDGINGPYDLASFNEEEFGWKFTGAIDTTDFCAGMSYLKYTDENIGLFEFFFFACEDQVEGTNPVLIWYNFPEGEGGTPINFDVPVGDGSSVTFVDVGGKHFIQTDKDGGLESSETVESTGDTTQIYGSFVIRNVPASTQLVFAVGNNADSFKISARSDSRLEINGVATPLAYVVDQVYVFYAMSSNLDEGADSIFVLDGGTHVCTIDHFDTTGEKIYAGSSGAADGVQVDHIMYFMANRTEEEGLVDLGYFFLMTDMIVDEYDYVPGFGPDVFPDYELGLFIYSGGVEALYETPVVAPYDWLYYDLQTILPAMAAR